MNERRTLILVISGLAAVGIGLLLYWLFRDTTPRSATVTNTTTPQVADEVRRVATFIDAKAKVPRDDRIVLFGDSLATSNTSLLASRLKEAFDQTPEILTTNQGTSVSALTGLIPVVEAPPRALIVDLARFDGAAELPMDHTLANLDLLQQKADQLGVVLVVLLGPSADSNLQYAATMKAGMNPSTLTVDATDLLMISRYRESLSVLNEQGMNELGKRLVEILTPLLKT